MQRQAVTCLFNREYAKDPLENALSREHQWDADGRAL